MVLALDSHAHCGLTLPFIMLHSLWEEGKIAGVSFFLRLKKFMIATTGNLLTASTIVSPGRGYITTLNR